MAIMVGLLFSVLCGVGIAGHAWAADEFLELTLSRPLSADSSHWDRVLDRDGGKQVLFGVKIAGPSPYARNPGRTFMPASVAKLFTTGAALERLGADFRYTTRMQWRRVDEQDPTVITGLRVLGEGDPSWGMVEFGETLRTRLQEFVGVLQKNGVRRIEGEVRFEARDSRWNELKYPFGWSSEDEVQCYGALAQAFNLDINCAFYELRGPGKGEWVEYGIPVPVKLEVSPGTKTNLWVRPDSGRRGEASRSFTIAGTWARGSAPKRFYLPVHRSPEWLENLFRQELRRVGITLATVARRGAGAAPGDVQEYLSFSPSLAEILRPLNKVSLNMLADALYKTLGERFGDPKTSLLEGGRAVLNEYFASLGGRSARALGFEMIPGFFSDQIVFWDGSGVSRESSVTTAAVMALLMDLSVSEDFSSVWESLSIAGVDGSLSSRMKGTEAEGVLRGKTGTLRGVYNLAGYVPRFDTAGSIAEVIPFVVLGETRPENRANARAAQDRLGAALVRAVQEF